MEFLKSVTFGWIINGLAWVIFIGTGNHVLEIIMGLLCIYSAYIGYNQGNNRLIISSLFDTLWMFAWGFGFMGDSFGITEFL